MADLTSLDAYDYHLPPHLIAQEPLPDRTASRLLVVHRQQGTWEHRHVRDLPDLLRDGDLLVLNNSRVLPARLQGRRTATGGRWEGLYLQSFPEGSWKLIGQTRGSLRPGETVDIPSPRDPGTILTIELQERLEGGAWRARPLSDGNPVSLLEQFGSLPLPHYIRGGEESSTDRERYQTVYARRPGSVAAPTAGLHFTPELLRRCEEAGISSDYVTLHVGLGTFRPVQASDIRQHVMHEEWCELPESTAQTIVTTRGAGNRVVAVGTTSLRTLETAARHVALPQGWSGTSNLFVYPPYSFRVTDGLLTNFHLPKSTLLMLVCAMGGHELIRAAYDEAVTRQYRFYSYGDAMLIL